MVRSCEDDCDTVRKAHSQAGGADEILDGEDWKPVKATTAYGISFGKFDRVEFAPVKTKSIRLTANSTPAAKRMGLLEFRLTFSQHEISGNDVATKSHHYGASSAASVCWFKVQEHKL